MLYCSITLTLFECYRILSLSEQPHRWQGTQEQLPYAAPAHPGDNVKNIVGVYIAVRRKSAYEDHHRPTNYCEEVFDENSPPGGNGRSCPRHGQRVDRKKSRKLAMVARNQGKQTVWTRPDIDVEAVGMTGDEDGDTPSTTSERMSRSVCCR